MLLSFYGFLFAIWKSRDPTGRGSKKKDNRTKIQERGTWNAEHGTWNAERGTRNAEHGTWNAERGTRNAERGTRNVYLIVTIVAPNPYSRKEAS